jgi:hypothetical protein
VVAPSVKARERGIEFTTMITTLDHISNGRAVLGLGAGWDEEEHRRYGFEFGSETDPIAPPISGKSSRLEGHAYVPD